MSTDQPKPVLVSREGALGRITLNRPEAINALTLEMFALIDAGLTELEQDPEIRCVLLDGAGTRGFCAGGDVVGLRTAVASGDRLALRTYYGAEYRLDARIGCFPKPVIPIMDGIVMGGGVGLAGHASHRVVTERGNVAMPEVRIGFSPDVGGTYLLGRSPGQLGVHLALTADSAVGADAIACGLADHFIPAAAIDDLIRRLHAGDVDAALAATAQEPPDSDLASARDWIDPAYSADTPERILARLHTCPEPAAQAAAEAIVTKSPTAVTVALRAVRQARKLPSLEAALAQEFRISLAMLALPDFTEGVRAALVDKDRHPRWSPDALDQVDPAVVDGCFAPLTDGELTFARPRRRFLGGRRAPQSPSASKSGRVGH